MRALRYTSYGGPVRVVDVPSPSCPRDGVLVRVGATGVCRSDWHAWQGHDPVPLPMVPGHELAGVVAEAGVPLCLMHARGTPADMQRAPRYDDVVAEIYEALCARTEAALSMGIARERLLLDPGIGFGKDLEHNLALLRALPLFHDFGLPLLLGVSRKRFIGTLSGAETPKARMPGSVAVALADKLDTLFEFWKIGETPTGSKDPFALRRAGLGVIRILEENGILVVSGVVCAKYR